MKTLSGIDVLDMREAFNVKARERKARREIGRYADKKFVTIHYNGPLVPDAVLDSDDAALDFILDVDVPNHINRLKADGIQYHLAILPSGKIAQLRDLDAVLWHCANTTGNRSSIAIHLAVGQGIDKRTGKYVVQVPNEEQMVTLLLLVNHLRSIFSIAKASVYGHKEWNGAVTECPGPYLMKWIEAYRAGKLSTETKLHSTWQAVRDRIRVRTEPTTKSAQAMMNHNPVFIGIGNLIAVDEIKRGETIEGTDVWLHLSGGIGWVTKAYFIEIK